MKKKLITIGVLLVLVVLGGSGALYWYSVTYQTVPDFIRRIPAFGPVLPSQSLTPTREPEEPEGEELNLTLIEKDLVIPSQYALGALELPRKLMVPVDAEINVFAAGRGKLRMMAVSPDWWPAGGGILYVTEQRPGNILALPDRDGDGVADEIVVVAAGLTNPNGLAFHDSALWVATEGKIIKYFDFDGNLSPEDSRIVISGLPTGGNHVTRTIAFDEDGDLYISVGSSCNVCEEERRAVVLRFDDNGDNEEVFARGTRNAVGITFGPDPWSPGERVLWGTENGRDWLGDDLPPDEINVLREGKHYGYPYCYADKVPDRTFRSTTSQGESIAQFCAETLAPVVKIQAHVAPLGLRFLESNLIPKVLFGDLLVALHGSWNRSEPVGHEILRISGLVPGDGSGPDPIVSTLISFTPKGSRDWGRPVDVAVGDDGSIYISDDAAGAIYRVVFTIDDTIEVP